jgi:hypothetical protein
MTAIAAAQAAGSIIQAGTSIYSGIQQSAAAESAAKNAKRQAKWEQMRAGAAAERQKQADVLQASGARARFAASGRDPGTGTPLEILASNAAFADADYRSILQGGEIASNNLKYQAKVYKQQGRDALIGAGLQAASSLAGGAGQAGQAQQTARLQDAYTANSGRPPPRNASGNWQWGWN